MSETKKFRCRTEELPVIASFLLGSFERDQADFENYSADFATTFIESYRDLIEEVETIINPSNLRAEQKRITGRLYENLENLRALVLKIEGYIRRAETLTVDHDNFGISELRRDISAKNIEGVLFFSRKVLQLLDDNNTSLSARGLTTDTISSFITLVETIKTDDLLQQQKMSRHTELVNTNIGICNQLWEKMNDLMDTGKRLYKYDNSFKLSDYTMDTLMKRVNRQTSQQVQETSIG